MSSDAPIPGAGFGNKTAPAPSAGEDDSTGSKLLNTTTSYTDAGGKYGSGATGGAGYGNKSNAPADLDKTDTQFSNANTGPYSDATEHGSGTTGGAGVGNKTGAFTHDSTLGKMMEKVGGLIHNEGLIEKGKERRKSQGYVAEAAA